MTSLLRDLALEKEDFSTEHDEILISSGQTKNDEKYSNLLASYEHLRASHHKTIGEVTVLRDTINTLQENYDEAKKQIDRQKQQALEFQEVEESCADLREECERHVQALRDLQACHSDLEDSLSESNNRLHRLQLDKRNLEETVQSKDNMIAKLERELCDVEKSRTGRSLTDAASVPVPPSSAAHQSSSLAQSQAQSSSSGDSVAPVDSHDHPRATLNPTELSLEEQVADLQECNRRSASRLAYVNTRLTAKDDTIQKLQNRIEEVTTERDSFKEALQMSFVAVESSPGPSVARSHSDSAINSPNLVTSTSRTSPHSSDNNSDGESDSEEKTPSQPQSSSGEAETKSPPRSNSTPSPLSHTRAKPSTDPSLPPSGPGNVQGGGGGGASVLGSWQSTMAVSSVADGFKGVLGSYLYAPGSQASTPSNLSSTGLSVHHKNYITNLEKKLQVLQKKNAELTELKSLIPVVEELREKVHEAEEAAKETDKWADEEFSTLNAKMDDLRQLRKEAVAKYQLSQLEVENLKQQISRTANTYSNFEDKLQEKVCRIQIVEKQLKALKESTVDMAVHEALQLRINALTGEAKHWQQKAQSLSKEMHRSMSVQMECNKKKEIIAKLEKKIEELEVERLSFKEAMQEAMMDRADMERSWAAASTSNSSSSSNDGDARRRHVQDISSAGRQLAKSWFGGS